MNRAPETMASPAEELYDRAFARMSEGRFQEALDKLKRAVALEPEHPKYATALAKLYDMLGEREKARALLARAMELRRKWSRPS